MNERTGGGDEAMDLELLARDDLLLDALGRSEPAPPGDDLAAMLAAWQADVADGAPAPALRPAAPDGEPTTPVPLPLTTPQTRTAAAPTPLPARRHRPWAVRLAAAAVALLALVAGLGVGSRNAGPGSPLWSLTRVLYPQQAEVRDVEELIAQARAALAAGDRDAARQLVDRARHELADVTDPATADRLRAELDALARDLAAAQEPPPATPPAAATPAPRPTTPAARPSGGSRAPAPQPSRSGAGGAPRTSPSGAASPLLPLPDLPLPSLSPLLPGLPLPTGGLLD
ncbi:anti-sigma-D factor RsdA [Micromonospora soli]|uniref:anti-sigma-D factor RsdA n=1 Tax=Micromonospora sp. NBRC 110009 TaxID=3061627 RepID=UPI002673049B|nr:anti-sigma-D factor RsdA [Micromonospora sp. NBRC 110009]WKT97787.1 anti-sigma-D factor RsdA [Micromonospora sp. NBRC 110009]